MSEAVEDPQWIITLEERVDAFFTSAVKWSGEIIFFEIPGIPMPFVVMWLLFGAVFISIYFGFIQFRGIKVAWDTLRGKYSSPDDPGEIPHYQALTSAVSGTVGLGNIAGVGAAVTLGGPGATFWMVLAGLFGMATKFAECTLGVKYREIREDGTVSGGPFKYLPVAFSKFPKFLSVALTGLFAIAILFFGVGGGNMLQANETYTAVRGATGGDDSFLASTTANLVFGVVLAAVIGLVIIGGMKSIGRVTSTLVPLMGGIYVLACIIVILTNIPQIPAAIGDILGGAFTAEGVTGGFVGALIVGLTRSAFSNEAGLGSAPIAHSVVKTRRPVSEGFVAMFEPFIDTVLICTMTALTIVIADTQFYSDARAATFEDGPEYDSEYPLSGVQITSASFEEHISWFPVVLAVAVALFAISTLITWSYYGQRAWNYLFGDNRVSTLIYRFVFLAFTVLGTILSFGQVLSFADNFLFVCAFVNLLGVFILLPVIKREMKEYLADRKSGKLAELGKLDADKEIAVEELAEANQVRDDSGQNRLADPDDDGFGAGGATTPRDRR
ncbi:D-alanine glycine permease [Serinicoccus sp. CNJ-927]|uniref:alanine/glycine:cation symporter family protein n=1 Tax=Serinicoccus sp. CNJ-927 TaxID=1904970 RepID=UPI00096299EE|nr:alanine/glycine:cation symporter family protein [Serinicoccus sp. CNJ-927]OLT41143.1 D-alanine glycine permease [Serinicoccus sp. CNJ-927]